MSKIYWLVIAILVYILIIAYLFGKYVGPALKGG